MKLATDINKRDQDLEVHLFFRNKQFFVGIVSFEIRFVPVSNKKTSTSISRKQKKCLFIILCLLDRLNTTKYSFSLRHYHHFDVYIVLFNITFGIFNFKEN